MKTFLLPDLGEGLHEATLIEWYATAQQSIKQGELLVAVETAKAVVEIPAPEDLTIDILLVQANTIVNVGMALLSYQPANEISPNAPISTKSVSVVGQLAEASTQHEQREFILGQQRFSSTEITQAQQALLAKTLTSISHSTEQIPLIGTRLAMMQQLSNAHQQVALVTIFDEVTVKWLAKTKPLPRLIKALCAACKIEPKLNAWFKNNHLILHNNVNVGLAVNTPQGLLVPVIANANVLNKKELTQHIESAKQAALNQQVSTAQATISLSNFGMLAGRFATPMIVPPQVAILGVGKITQQRFLSKKGKLKKYRVVPLSLSFDHRVLTGAEAAHFLAAVIEDLKAN